MQTYVGLRTGSGSQYAHCYRTLGNCQEGAAAKSCEEDIGAVERMWWGRKHAEK